MAEIMLRLRELMQEQDITQDELSRKTGIPQGTISRWAGNKVDTYRKDIILRLCDYFDVEVGDLIVRMEKTNE